MNPGYPDAVFNTAASHHTEGIKLAAAGRFTEAIQHIEAATQLCPGNPVWQFNRGLTWQQLKNFSRAVEAYRAAIGLVPDFFDAWNNLSAALKSLGEIEPAVDAAQKAVSFRPQSAAAYINLGNAVKARGEFEAAETAYRQASQLEPGNPRAQLNLANTLREMGRLSDAIDLLRQIVTQHPRFPEAHRDLAFALLLSGDLPAGWEENEWRWGTEDLVKSRRTFEQPAWQGEDLRGRTLFVHTEQGFGDSIQFCRYIEFINQLGGRTIFECQPGLKRIFQSLVGVNQLVVPGELLPPFDYHLPLLSFPRIFQTELDSIPNRCPYLRAPLDWIPVARPALGIALHVGLVWAGNPDHRNDHARSISLELLKPLLDMPEVRFYSLQVGARSQELRRWTGAARLVDLGPMLTDFASTAAAIDKMDLVLCVDTSVAHLAGALAKPVWLMLPFAPDWRWLLNRDTSPWYPSMRLFRQAQPNDWSEVVTRIRSALQKETTKQTEIG